MAGTIFQGFSGEYTCVSATPTAPSSGSINTTTGSTFFCVARDYSPSVTAATDNYSNTYSQVGTTVTIGSTGLSVWMCENGTGGTGHKPSVTKSTGDLISFSFFEVTGSLTASSLDGTAGAGLDTSSPFNATVTTGNANDLIITVGGSNGAATTITYTPGAGFTLAGSGVTWATGTNGLALGVMSQNVSATGTYGGNFTQSSGTQAGVITFALKDAGGGGGGATSRPNFSLLGVG
jgi:hypothetical protein